MRVLFVHGTGVRRDRHDELFGRVRRRLLERFPDASVTSCFWGEQFGVTLAAGGRSVPGRRGTRAVGDGAAAPPEQEAAEWALLLADPLCELRVLADTEGATDGGFGLPGVRSAGSEVLDLLAKFPADWDEGDELGGLLRGTDLARHYPDALETVRASDEATRAAAQAFEEPAAREVAVAAARALVAEALARAGADAECTGAERDRMVEVITARLGGDARWPGGRAAALLGKLALRVTTQPALNLWRGPITEGATPFLGDILRYQARGQALRDHLHHTITAGDGPTVLIGHSLGGVALVDLLAQRAARGEPLRGPRLVVTVGSQAPFLHELGALAGLEPGDPLPDGFPRWLNIYDRQDMLAFLAEPVFPDDPRVTDHEVSSRQPFPPCHSAYWKVGGVYDGIARAVAETG
jgi:hypothetical protein